MTVSSKIEKCIGFDGFKVLFFAAATICKGEELKKRLFVSLTTMQMRQALKTEDYGLKVSIRCVGDQRGCFSSPQAAGCAASHP
jgi:hypothetical protein